MSESCKDKETLSALLDNEADDLELRRLLRTLEELSSERRAELGDTWSRYHLAQSVLHESGVPVSPALAQRIETRLAEEPAHGGQPYAGTWRQQLVRLAIAASVAVAVVLGIQAGLEPQQPGQPLAANANGDATGSEEALVGPADNLLADSEQVELDPEGQGLVRDYIRGIVIDPSEPAAFEHIKDSPLYRLVNLLPARD